MGLFVSRHLQIFNPQPRPTEAFRLFPQLPAEIRQQIWECALTRERIFRVELEDDKKEKNRGVGKDGNFDITRMRYVPVIRSCNIVSKILRVSREARQAALRFYRIRIPCQLDRKDGKGQVDAIFYFNPEMDILWMNNSAFGAYHFVNFLHHLRTADPLKIGLLNLCTTEHDLGCLSYFSGDEFDSGRWESFTSVLGGLRQVYFLCFDSMGRAYSGPGSPSPSINGWEMYRSRPIWSYIPTFDRMPRDPRAIERDLRKVFVGVADPRRGLYGWQQYLRGWGIDPRPDVQHRLIVTTYSHFNENVKDRKSAASWLRDEDMKWRQIQYYRREDAQNETGREIPLEDPEELQRAPQSAVGFWVFPAEAVGDLPSLEESYDSSSPYWERHRVLDLTEYPPELCLSSMP